MIRPWRSRMHKYSAQRRHNGRLLDRSSINEATNQNLNNNTIIEGISKLFPILAGGSAGIAIAFDIGYFYGIDINLFTLFSISEHMLFSLEALPIALLAMLCLIIFLTIINTAMRPLLKYVLSPTDGAQQHKKLRPRKTLFYGAALAIYILIVIFYTYYTNILYVLMIIISQLPIFFKDIPRKYMFGIILQVIMYVNLVIFSLMVGVHMGEAYISDDLAAFHKISTNAGGVIYVRVIRSGERGVLFFDINDKHIKLLKWGDIEDITSLHGINIPRRKG